MDTVYIIKRRLKISTIIFIAFEKVLHVVTYCLCASTSCDVSTLIEIDNVLQFQKIETN